MGQVIGVDTTYTGNPASFTGISGAVATGVSVPLSPIQDLHGYSAPWAAGAGKNKCPISTKGSSTGTVSFTNNLDGSWTVNGTSGSSNTYAPGSTKCISLGVLSAGNYCASLQHSDGTLSSNLGIRIGEGNDSTYLASGTGSCTFTADGTSEYWFTFMLPANNTASNELIWLQVETGSTVTSYAPYSNICPITGRTGANVYRTGKSLCRVAFAFGTSQGVTYTENADGTVHAKGTATGESFSAGSITGSVSNIDSRCMYTVPAGTYTISNIAGVRIWVQFRNADNTAQTGTNVNIAVGASHTITFTEPAIIYVRSDIATGTVVDTDMQVMVTEGSTAATVYEPWQKQTVTVDWTSVAGTVYGGSFDSVTGALSSTMANIASYNGETIGEPWLSSMDEYVAGTTPTTGAQVVYTLTTPVEYQLTPQQVAVLIGQNYVWSDANSTVSVVVRAPMTGFAGWLIKAVTNGTPVEIPLKYIRAETYTVTPDQRMEWSAERDVTGVLHRETVQNLPPKIEFNTPLMTNADINTLNGIIRAAFTNYLQRNITIQFYDPERDQYWEWDCYMPDVHYSIRNADTVNHVINYEELRYAFIGR